jgi:predicted PurR-regulated permease PerM
VLGGIAFFGVFGFLLGPLTVSMIFTLLDIYVSDRKKVA